MSSLGSPVINHISIQGFKSFGPRVTARLRPLNFIVGANASGKTNLISALRFVQATVGTNLEQALGEFGGKSEVWNKIQRERKEGKHLEVQLTMGSLGEYSAPNGEKVEVSSATYRIKVELPLKNGRAAIVGEHLLAALNLGGETYRYKLNRTRDRLQIHDPTDERFAREQTINLPPGEETRSAAAGGAYTRAALFFRDHVSSWAFYNFSAEVGRVASREAEAPLLGSRGENLATVLHEIEAHDGGEALREIEDGMRGVIPSFTGLKTVSLPFEAKWGFQIREEKLQSAINPQSASDGTIRLLLLLVAACWNTRNSPLVAIEEPENGLHPFLAEQLVNLFRHASSKRQFLIATHNPYFLDHLNPEELLLCDKEDGFTTLRRAADVEEINGFKKHFSLGELWTQGVLGGIP